jgi:general stress protein YciG
MTSQSPRIYTYKITFEEVPYYYYGSKKEKYYNQEYWGSPKTNKWCWEFYTPKKQILEFFEFSDEGYIEAQEVEGRLIKPVYNTDKWCLNESCGGQISLKVRRETGKKIYEEKLGIHSLTTEQRSENGKKVAKMNEQNGTAIYGMSKEQKSEAGKVGGKIGGKKGAKKTKELGVGIFAMTSEELSFAGRKGGKIGGSKSQKTLRENKLGIYAITSDEQREIVAKTNSQKWMCLETGHITTSGPLTLYQRARGIDTSKNNRRRIS